jgi:hypothetical protein
MKGFHSEVFFVAILRFMKIRHTVIFTFYESTTHEQINDVIGRLNEMGEYLVNEVGVTDWVVAKHIPESFKSGRAHLLQDGIFPTIDSLSQHASSEAHKRVVELTPKVSDWMTVDTIVPETS